MMTNEEVKQEIIKALKLLETVNCYTNNKSVQTNNGKKVREAYEILYNLKNEEIFKKNLKKF